jgi:flavin reductase (DIM6/NTAB) family NADH-FMN oxidoreductase RutF
MPVDSTAFRQCLGQFASGVTVVTTLGAEGPLGLTVSSFCSVSLEPPLVLVCVDNRSETHEGFESSKLFGVSILAEGQEAWSTRFAFAGEEKFSGVDLDRGEHGIPLIPGALAQLECRLTASLPGGDHTIYVGEVLRMVTSPGRPLLYHGSAYHRLHARKARP